MNIAFVPVRGGSKSIPSKNIKSFCGRPLVYWCLNSLQNSTNIDQVIVSTDSEEIKSIVQGFSMSKVEIFDRDNQNSKDISSTEDVMLEFLDRNNLDDQDLFILVQATSPLTESNDFDQALKQIKTEKADSLLTCVRSKRFYWNNNNSPLNYDYMQRPRRQEFEGTLMENGAFYINYVKNIKLTKNRLSKKISIYEMEDFKAIELDEPDDWEVSEDLMRKYLLIESQKQIIKLFLSDVDGTLTDASMYYGQNGEEHKRFNTHDGKGFELLKKAGIKTGIITSENTKIVENRAKKLNVDYLFQGLENQGKLNVVKDICAKEGINLSNVAYVGDDINCKELLENVGFAACPADSIKEIKKLPKILSLTMDGGRGSVREFADIVIKSNDKRS